MGVSSYPSPGDAGVLCVIVANTAISISIVKDLVCSMLDVIGIHFESSSEEEFSVDSAALVCGSTRSEESYNMEDFRSKTPTILFKESECKDCECCSICLAEFQANEEINNLSCGHVFHKLCLEKWFKYWNTTCPLCRNNYMMMMMPPQEIEQNDATSCPM